MQLDQVGNTGGIFRNLKGLFTERDRKHAP